MFYCYQILCFSMSNDLNAFNFFIYSYSSLMKYFFSTSEFCVVYTFYWLSDEGITRNATIIDLLVWL